MKLPKKYIKKYGISAKAWREYKKTLKGRTKAKRSRATVKRTVKRKTAAVKKKRSNLKNNIIIYGKTKTTKKRTTTMAKRRKTSKKMGKARRRRAGFMNQRTVSAIVKGGMTAVGVITGLVAVNKLPWVKDQQPWIKAASQIALGIAGLTLVKQPMGKQVAAGIVTSGALSFILPMLPEGVMAGARRLSPTELNALRTGKPANILMGKPYNINTAGGSRTRAQVRKRF